MANNTIAKNEHPPVSPSGETVEVIGVNFKSAGKVYYFAPGKVQAKRGDSIIVETARGIELGHVAIANRTVPASEITPPLRPVIRLATQDDLDRAEGNKKLEEDAMRVCRAKIAAHKLDMKLVGAEYTFDNNKLLFYFTSEGRVDFRELVKDLASYFKTRIELRQIGIRDEAKLLGGLGVCGRALCCNTFLSDFAQVSIKMAKEQNFSLNSTKISGCCGRLMCCFRYEHETYEEEIKLTPSVGSIVSTDGGNGVVIESRPLTHEIKVRLDDKPETPRTFNRDDVSVVKSGKAPKNGKDEKTSDKKAGPASKPSADGDANASQDTGENA